MRLNKLFDLWDRPELERRLNNHSQTAAAADKQFAEIVARNVFHHFAAGFDEVPVRQGDLDADQVIANRAATESSGPAGVGCKQCSNSQAVRPRRVDGEPLAALRELRLQRRQRDARFHRYGQIFRRVIHHAVKRAHIDRADLFAACAGVRQNLPQIVQTGWLNRHR